jgi:GDP-L-fucose synthase
MTYPLEGKRIWVAGHRGMVGAAVCRRLAAEPVELLTVDRATLDLRRQAEVEAWMAANRPQAVIVASATVGGIAANDASPADFLFDNLAIETAIIHGAHLTGVEKLLFLGSSCIYPRDAAQPMAEDALLTGPLEPTNEWYAIAKIAGIKLCQAYRRQHGADYISAMPTNLYGPGDNFDIASSHVLPALLRKIDAAKDAGEPVTIWGTGRPRREFLYVEDLADALVFLLRHYSGYEHINVGTGTDLTITELAELVAEVVGYRGRFVYDAARPDGTPQKLMDSSRLAALGWRPATALRDGIALTYRWFLDHRHEARGLSAAE